MTRRYALTLSSIASDYENDFFFNTLSNDIIKSYSIAAESFSQLFNNFPAKSSGILPDTWLIFLSLGFYLIYQIL